MADDHDEDDFEEEKPATKRKKGSTESYDASRYTSPEHQKAARKKICEDNPTWGFCQAHKNKVYQNPL